jgi:hypothetical protein
MPPYSKSFRFMATPFARAFIARSLGVSCAGAIGAEPPIRCGFLRIGG